MFSRKATFILLCSALIVIISMGTRQAFGLFLQPVSEHLGVGREVFSLAMALQNIIFGFPIVGIVADRYGSRWVAVMGALLYATGLLLISNVSSPTGLYLTLGLWMGIGLASISYVVILGAVGQVVPVEKRSTAFGLVTAAGSFGMFSVVPGAQWLLSSFGWQNALMILAGFVSLMALLALGFPSKPGGGGSRADAGFEEHSLPQILLKARDNSSYWLLNAGFFVCGFHVAFIATHLPSFLTDNGVAAFASATALSMIGLFNIFGSSLFGYLGDRYRKKHLLSFLYFARAIVITLFLLIPLTSTSAIIFGCAIGFLWLATVPLTSGMVAQIFGSRYLSSLYGIVFFSHQIGSFLGVWLGGRIYDMSGSYNGIWIAGIVLGVVAAILHLPISETPISKQMSVEAAAG